MSCIAPASTPAASPSGALTTVPAPATLHGWLDTGQAERVAPFIEQLRRGATTQPEQALVLVRTQRQLGADRDSDALSLRTGRRFAAHGEAVLGMLRTVASNRGAYAYWRVAQRVPEAVWATSSDQAGQLSLRGLWLAQLRDERAALTCQREALALNPGDPWLWVEHSYALASLDRTNDALDAAGQALNLRPGYRTAVMQSARLLRMLRRTDDSVALLQSALQNISSAVYAWALAAHASDAEQYAHALELLDRVEALLPLADKGWRNDIAARRADALLALGRTAEARDEAAKVSVGTFYPQLAARLAATIAAGGSTAPSRRRLITLPLVAQHWMTCAPATLAALSAHWGHAADHLEVAQDICYDGTPQASERAWAVSQGFYVREFKLDWDTACALIDAGVPCALATQHVGSGHLQAVVGYDQLCGTLLIRDPNAPLHVEYEASRLFAQQQASGPRAMVLLPPSEQHRLAGIELPEAAQWDLGHDVLAALQRHNRPAALAASAALEALAPGSDTAWRAKRAVAIYDGDEPRILAATEALLDRYPQDRALQLSRLASLFEVQGQAAGEAYLAELVAMPGPDPQLLARWASELARDARRLPAALSALRRALRLNGTCARAWHELANLQWTAHGAANGAALALEPARYASTLQPTEEWAAAAYARTCRIAGRAEDGVAWLRERVDVWGDRSSEPVLTLIDELDTLRRDLESQAALDDARRRRPDDSTLLLAMAERALFEHRLQAAEQLLDACCNARAPTVLRLRATLREALGDLDAALADAEAAVSLQPLHLPHHRLLLRLLRRQLGDQEAVARWRHHADAHPAHVGLQRLLYDALPDDPRQVWSQLEHMHRWHPDLPWLQRERAMQASRQGRHDEAVSLARQALEASGASAAAHDVMAFCVQRRDGYAAARPHMLASLRLDVEFESAFYRLFGTADVVARREAADLVAHELRRQPLLGDGLLFFQTEAAQVWPGAEVLSLLKDLASRWPGLWQGPVAIARQCLQMQQPDEALSVLSAATDQFPLLPRLHYEHGEALRLAGRLDDALQANARAIALSPAWNQALRLQVDLLCKHQLRWDDAEPLLKRALQSRDGWADADLMGLLAWVHEHQKRPAEALAMARRALCLDPAQDWVWAIVRRLCDAAETPHVLDEVVEEVVASRPGDAAAWVVRAERSRDDIDGLRAAEEAIRLDARNTAAWQARFERLRRLGRLDEIRQALLALPWPDKAPISLRAWSPKIEWLAQRHDSALAQQQALCEEAPHDEQLCATLADWLDERGRDADYLSQADVLVSIAPLEARSHLYKGHALVKLQRWQEAIPCLQKALDLAPSYLFAARQLAIAAKESAQADIGESALQRLWPHSPDPPTACDGIELAVLAGNLQRALEWLQRLFVAEGFEIDRTRAALVAMREAGWADALAAMQAEQVARGGGPVGLGLDWLDEQARHLASPVPALAEWRVTAKALQLQESAQGSALLLALMRWLTLRKDTLLLAWVVRRCEARLRADDMCWGETSYALCSLKRFGAVANWLHDWRIRTRPPAFALANLAGSLAVLGRWTELRDLVETSLKRQPLQEDLRLWQLLVLAEANDLPALRLTLQRLHEWTPDEWMLLPIKAVEAFLNLAERRAEGDTIGEFRASAPLGGPPQAWAMWRALRRFALLRHTPWTRWIKWM